MFALRLKELREEAGLSQAAFAKMIGKAQSTVGGWESGAREPSLEMVKQIADFFHVTTDYLIDEENKSMTPTFDDFTYAMHNEGKELSEEDKQTLLAMAKFLRQQKDLQKNEKGE